MYDKSFSKIRKMDKYFFLFWVIFGLISCSSSHRPIETTDVEVKEICTLGENLALIKAPVSFSMIGGDRFIISDGNGVYLYGTDGNQISRIGRAGRARCEYNMPSIARCYGDSVYIWCPMSLKFVTWSLDGQPGTEYGYPSAVSDFTPTDNELFIYTAGRREDNVIDIYDKSVGDIRKTLQKASDRHRLLLVLRSSYPMYMAGNDFYFMSKDLLALMHYNKEKGELYEESSIVSDSFRVDEDLSVDLMDRGMAEAFSKVHENPQTLFLCPSRKGFYVLTKEGVGKMSGGVNNYKTDYSDAAISLYEIKKKGGDRLASYRYDSIGTLSLFGYCDNSIYFIKSDVKDGDDVYTLNQLVIPD